MRAAHCLKLIGPSFLRPIISRSWRTSGLVFALGFGLGLGLAIFLELCWVAAGSVPESLFSRSETLHFFREPEPLPKKKAKPLKLSARSSSSLSPG